MTAKFTSGGMERGARPICDGRVEVEENGREAANPGRRKEVIEHDGTEANAFSTPLDRAVVNIVA